MNKYRVRVNGLLVAEHVSIKNAAQQAQWYIETVGVELKETEVRIEREDDNEKA